MKTFVIALGACVLSFVALAPFTRERHAPWLSAAHPESAAMPQAKRPSSLSRAPSEPEARVPAAPDLPSSRSEAAVRDGPAVTGSVARKISERAVPVRVAKRAARVAHGSRASYRVDFRRARIASRMHMRRIEAQSRVAVQIPEPIQFRLADRM